MARADVTVVPGSGDPFQKTLEISHLYNLGSATRDAASAVAHQEEVAYAGVAIAFDVPAPNYHVALLTKTVRFLPEP